jgi:hypothetical protein
MRNIGYRRRILRVCVAAGSLLWGSPSVWGQEAARSAASDRSSPAPGAEVSALAGLIRDLQTQVQGLNAQLHDLQIEQQRTQEEATELRHELEVTREQLVPGANAQQYAETSPARTPMNSSAPKAAPPELVATERLTKLEDEQELTNAKVNDQYQTKVESGSKYRLRLSGIALLNLFSNRGNVDNIDFPQLAEPPDLLGSPGNFGGTIRQSQIRVQAFGPDIAGARTSADVQFDFAGGFPKTWNGTVSGVVRLRTGTIRLDWANTSIIAGQDHLFFAPLSPTSLATLAVPPLSYAGNLWAWTPQVRVEHRIAVTDSSSLQFQGGILDSVSADMPYSDYYRYPSWGEESGQPAYAARIAWSHRAFGQNLTAGIGGYYGRQNWGFNRNIDGWAGTADLTLPLGKRFEFTGEFYRGRAAGGFGAAIGQTALLTGSIIKPTSSVIGLDSIGGWAQLKFKATSKLEVNGALGLDSPYASELRRFSANPSYFKVLLSRNLSPFVNFVYQVRSDLLFSTEYRRLQTYVLDQPSNKANHINFSLGYLF